ncbi:MAG: DUF6888 family protein [Stenomitos frigidus ULC029]
MYALTAKQALKAVKVCQSLSTLYRDITLFRVNPLTGEIYILAGENIEISIDQDGSWEFSHDT